MQPEVRRCLSRKMFPNVYPVLKDELSEEELWEALAKHGECWTGDVVDPAVASAAVGKLMKMGGEATARDRLDNVLCRMEKYFDLSLIHI